MPLRAAARRCPDAVFLPTDPEAYGAASAEVMAALRTLPVVVEVWGWDEAYIGAVTDDPEALAHRVRATVLDATALSCSVGIGDTKLRAKTATGFAKPGGVAQLTADLWLPTMGERPTVDLWGIGSRTAAKLAAAGISTVAELAAADPDELAARFGPTTGPWLGAIGRGEGSATVRDEPWVARSRSRERTYAEDLVERAEVEEQVQRLAREVTEDVTGEGRRVARVAVKVRSASFWTRTTIAKLPSVTTDADVVAATAVRLLDRLEVPAKVRLLGVRVELEPPEPDPSPAAGAGPG
jgi:DNA polymerase-4